MQEGKLKNFSEKAEDFLKLLDRMDNYKQFCVKNLSDLDKSLSDLDHALELVGMDGVKMIKLTSKRKQILLERRTNKDELDRIDAIYSKIKDTQSFYGQLQAACNSVKETNKKLEDRKYIPRVLYEEFGFSADEKEKIEQRKKDAANLVFKDVNGKIHKPTKKQLDMEEKFREIASK